MVLVDLKHKCMRLHRGGVQMSSPDRGRSPVLGRCLPLPVLMVCLPNSAHGGSGSRAPWAAGLGQPAQKHVAFLWSLLNGRLFCPLAMGESCTPPFPRHSQYFVFGIAIAGLLHIKRNRIAPVLRISLMIWPPASVLMNRFLNHRHLFCSS